MELKITDEAQAKLKPYFDDPNAVVLLDLMMVLATGRKKPSHAR